MPLVPVENRFYLAQEHLEAMAHTKSAFGFGGLGEVIFYRSYSRVKDDGAFESWNDTLARVINGTLSIRKHHYLCNAIAWDEAYWQEYASGMARSLFAMEWMPAGRGLWAMGTEYVYERGSMALNNCGACDTSNLSHAAEWAMDALMCGVGVGFNTAWPGGVTHPDKSDMRCFVVPDSKEGWAESVRMLVDAYTKNGKWPRFDYTQIRPGGAPIRGFGGTASGSEPLMQLHGRIESTLDAYCAGEITRTRCIVDIFNAIGLCVVSGNVRRSAELALGRIDDKGFLELKNYEKYPEREAIGWVSNSAVALESSEDMQKLSLVVDNIIKNGEPGVINFSNVQRYGRMCEERTDDTATLANPCGEIALESFELCNLAETFPTRCESEARFLQALEYATFYTSTVALLPTHRSETNRVMAKNRRIGVSIGGIAQFLESAGMENFRRLLGEGYECVKACNAALAKEAKVNPSLRLTTVKPSGSLSLLAGVTPGIHYPLCRYVLRRITMAASELSKVLIDAGVPCEKDIHGKDTLVFEFPMAYACMKTACDLTVRQQFELLALLQREWSDNMISCSIGFDPEYEEGGLEDVLAEFLPQIKSVSLYPRTPNLYPQMPYECIDKAVYERRSKALQGIDFSPLQYIKTQKERFSFKGECEC